MEEKLWHQHYDYNVPTTLRAPRIPVHELLALPANAYPDKTAINFGGTEITFWELREMSIRMANAFAELGIQKGDRVGIDLPNLPQYLIAYYAAMYLGAVVVNFNPLYTAEELTALIKQTGLKAFVTFEMVLPQLKTVCQTVDIPLVIGTGYFDFLEGVDASTPESLGFEPSWHHFSQLLDGSKDLCKPKVDISPEDPAVIQFTGGTTGIPKGATLTHANMIYSTLACSLWGSATVQYTPPEKRIVMCVLPLFHVYANIVCMNWAMFNCATMILVPRFEIEDIMNILAGFERITFFPAVPTMINAVVNHPRAEELNLAKRIDLLNSGGGPIPVELIDQVKDMGIYCSEGWGMSETTSLGISNPLFGLKKTGSIGIPMPGMDIRIVDLDTAEKDVSQGERGELLIKGPLIMKGYWDNPEKTAEELKEGWLYTGDIVTQDEDGYLFIVDRKKDMVIAGGYNIYPRDIDEVLYQHPKVLDAVSVGIPHEYRGETMKAYVVLKEGVTATEEEIIAFCKEKLAVYKVPKSVEFRDELPKSAVGKILRKALRDEEAEKSDK
ncbi:MAG: long-chain fatty acid--CoA ligase [Proteobacteria bacterium]|nr:long-chain fatty acid--CoA ligase [Pseudomonadota bacterium]